MGYDVTVYTDIEKPVEKYGVKWKPYYTINWGDKFNILILWRSPHLVRMANAKHLYMDLHDVVNPLDWNIDILDMNTDITGKLDKIFFKSEYHRNLLPDLNDKKCVIISNGINETT